MSKVQEAGRSLRIVFTLSKWPRLLRAYLVTVCNRSFVVVHYQENVIFIWHDWKDGHTLEYLIDVGYGIIVLGGHFLGN